MKRTNALALVAMFGLVGLFAIPALAQANLNAQDDAWWNRLELQLIQSLDVPVEQIQVETLQHIIFFANNYPDKIDLTNASPALLDIYASQEPDDRRIMALVALHAIGNDLSMRHLATVSRDEASARVRNFANAVLADYYGG